jgi:hypothetical protein
MEWIFDAWSYVASNGKEIFWWFLTISLIVVVPSLICRNGGTDWDRDYGPIIKNEDEMTVAEQVIAFRIADQTSLLRTNTMWLQAIYAGLVFFGLMIGNVFLLND